MNNAANRNQKSDRQPSPPNPLAIDNHDRLGQLVVSDREEYATDAFNALHVTVVAASKEY